MGASTVAGGGKGAAGGRSWSAARALASAEIVDGGGATGCGGWLEGPDSFATFVLVLVMAGVTAVAGADGGGDGSEVWATGRTATGLAAATDAAGMSCTTAADGPGTLASSKLRLPATAGAGGRGRA